MPYTLHSTSMAAAIWFKYKDKKNKLHKTFGSVELPNMCRTLTINNRRSFWTSKKPRCNCCVRLRLIPLVSLAQLASFLKLANAYGWSSREKKICINQPCQPNKYYIHGTTEYLWWDHMQIHIGRHILDLGTIKLKPLVVSHLYAYVYARRSIQLLHMSSICRSNMR